MSATCKTFLPVGGMFGVVAMLLAGCSTGPTPVFNDEASIPKMPTNSIAQTKTLLPGLGREDQTTIELMIFRNLLTQHLWNQNGPTAIFLEADDAEVAKLRGEFPGLIPPIKPTSHIDLTTRNMPLDKDTGKPAIILSVEFTGTAPDGSVQATGKWYSSNAAMGFCSFLASRNGDGWNLQTTQ